MDFEIPLEKKCEGRNDAPILRQILWKGKDAEDGGKHVILFMVIFIHFLSDVLLMRKFYNHFLILGFNLNIIFKFLIIQKYFLKINCYSIFSFMLLKKKLKYFWENFKYTPIV